ncbi:AraC family transcriptional regulator [Fulvivirga sp. RKSG066]|uniref:helix-turn-helix domain-containing protein n=1 Tax=Fulvivirga aurantia TaxID=2529383 RepID=UPI0012BB9A4D|nr:helix-turn-helix domain-containing protein [Fulvivirga aurantia]MTI20403.1 AraC family transcriptional regulator [Fulvivirga aurantia]
MKQFLYIPQSPVLRECVHFFSYIENDQPQDNEWVALFPNATTNIAFSLNGPLELSGNHKLSSSVSSTCTTSIAMNTSNFKACIVQLKPYGFYKLAKTPMYLLKNSMAHCDLFFSASELNELCEKLQSEHTPTKIFATLEDFFSEKIDDQNIDQRVSYGLDLLNSTQLSMDELSSRLCLSNRGLHKLFTQQVGISPKYYQKIVRFNKLANAIASEPDKSLTSLSHKVGYFDQAHSIKDFKYFADMSPIQYRKLKANSTDFYNFKTTEPHKFDKYIKL